MASTSQQGIELQDDDPSAILTSIEDLLLQLLEGLSQGRLPILQVVGPSLSFSSIFLSLFKSYRGAKSRLVSILAELLTKNSHLCAQNS